jgi:hypothetical protein
MNLRPKAVSAYVLGHQIEQNVTIDDDGAHSSPRVNVMISTP